MNIGLFIGNENRRKMIADDLESLFGTNEIFSAKVTGINADASQVSGIKTPARLAQLIMKQFTVMPGNLLIIEWKNLEDDVLVSSDRTIFVSDRVGELKGFRLKPFSCQFSHFPRQHQRNSTKSSELGSFATTRSVRFSGK
jgi:hypothetical protein